MRKQHLMTILCALAVGVAFLALPARPTLATSSADNTACRSIYIVLHGDTLSASGASYHASYGQIATASGIPNPNLIFPGQRLCIRGNSRSTETPAPTPAPAPSAGSTSNTPAGICAWCPPAGHPAFGPVPDFSGDPYSSDIGQCTWWAATRRLDENFWGLGTYAYQWAINASARGFRAGSTPAVGATVIFQPGVDGASQWGHAAHVEAIYSGGWFLVSEMNFYWNGGGWDRVSYRYVHVGSGVSFLY